MNSKIQVSFLTVVMLFMSLILMIQPVYASGKKMKRNAVQEYANDPNAKELRAYGIYNDYEENDPWASAKNNARGELATKISAYVTSLISTQRRGNQQRSGNDVQKSSSNSMESAVQTAAEQVLIRGARVAKEEAYKQKDGTITAYVCMEIDLGQLEKNLAESGLISNADEEDGLVLYDLGK